jgi:hypothetical protein
MRHLAAMPRRGRVVRHGLEEMEGSPMTDEIDKAIDDAFRCSACGRIVL